MAGENHRRLSDSEFEQALRALHDSAQTRVRETQGGVPTFFDNLLPTLIEHAPNPGVTEFLEGLIVRKRMGRFVNYAARRDMPGSDIPNVILAMSQGVDQSMSWKGQVLFKTSFDLAIYQQLLAELKPATIIEIGSGQGASAQWMADVVQAFNLKPRIISLDLEPPEIKDSRIEFMAGDCANIHEALPAGLLSSLPHPWMIVEDAHVNVTGVLKHLDTHMQTGDYVVVEDSDDKHSDIEAFLTASAHAYCVDTRYTDLFGHNVTCSPDSVFRLM